LFGCHSPNLAVRTGIVDPDAFFLPSLAHEVLEFGGFHNLILGTWANLNGNGDDADDYLGNERVAPEDELMSVELRPLGVKCNIQCQYCYQNPQRDAGNVLQTYDVAKMQAAIEQEGGPFTLFGGEGLMVPEPDLE